MKEERRNSRTPDESMPYLQPKTELDAEETRKHELEANKDGKRNELEQGGRYEIEGGAEGKLELPSLMTGTHELGGEEHPRELDGREIILSSNHVCPRELSSNRDDLYQL